MKKSRKVKIFKNDLYIHLFFSPSYIYPPKKWKKKNEKNRFHKIIFLEHIIKSQVSVEMLSGQDQGKQGLLAVNNCFIQAFMAYEHFDIFSENP